jgi:muconolactone delta-isomerase
MALPPCDLCYIFDANSEFSVTMVTTLPINVKSIRKDLLRAQEKQAYSNGMPQERGERKLWVFWGKNT